jgi:hypothetical protein
MEERELTDFVNGRQSQEDTMRKLSDASDKDEEVKAISKMEDTVLQLHAYAVLRAQNHDYQVTSRTVILGREKPEGASTPFIKVSSSKKVSRKAARIYFH